MADGEAFDINTSLTLFGNSSLTEVQCVELPDWGFVAGIVMGVFGSVGINIGQNIQANGLAALPPELLDKPHKSKTWLKGLALFIGFSMLNFAAFALAPASILTPLESIQLVTNVFYNKFINKTRISRKLVAGTSCAVIGTVFTIVFGPPNADCSSVTILSDNWTKVPWITYLCARLIMPPLPFVRPHLSTAAR
jgi:hypothetical protein